MPVEWSIVCNRKCLTRYNQHAFDPEQYHANEMFFKVNLKTMQLDAEYELEGKSLDD